MKRKKLELIVKQVLDGTLENYVYELDGKKVYSLHKGNKYMLGRHDKDVPCLTIILQNPMGETWVNNQQCIDSIVDTIESATLNFDSMIEQKHRIAAYLTSEKGKWGRGS